MSAERVDVLIAGAGPGGAAAALLFARAGLHVVAVDGATFPRDKPCSEFMSPATVAVLDRLGVLGVLDTGGARPSGTTVHGPRGASLTGLFERSIAAPLRTTGLSIARRTLDAELVGAARRAGAAIHEGTAVQDLLYEGGGVGGVVVRGRDGSVRTIRARLTIGADGLRSVVARRLGPRRQGHPRRIAFVAHVAGVTGLKSTAELHVASFGYLGLNPVGGGVTNVALVVGRASAGQARGDVAGFFRRMLERFPGVVGRVDLTRIVREILVTGPFAASTARVTTEGALLLGDAAEFFDPFTGEGIYRALHGAELAVEVAIAAFRRPGIVRARDLLAYRSLRRSAFAGQWAVERIIGWMMFAPALFDRAVARLERRGLAHTLIGVTGDILPARAVLNPGFLLRAVL